MTAALVCAECSVRVFWRPVKGPKLYLCSRCADVLCPKHAHFYADESNAAITKSALPKCRECFEAAS